ncbi:MAG: hypothetical protein Q8R18_05340 [bacterium]|nr:hypothetical protein [bacterium]
MKKIGMIFIIFLLGISLASASFFGESWGFLITGNVVAEGNAGILEGEEVSGSGEGSAPASDGGSSTPAPETSPAPSGSGDSGQSMPVEGEQKPQGDQNYQQYQGEQRLGSEPRNEKCFVGDQEVPCQQNQGPDNYQQFKGEQRAPEDSQTIEGQEINMKSGDYKQQVYGENWCKNGQCCPDSICDDFEQKTGGCSMDCGRKGSQQTNQYQESTPIQNYVSQECLTDDTLNILQEKCETNGGTWEIIDVNGCSKPNCKLQQMKGNFISGGGYDQNSMQTSKLQCEQMDLVADVESGINGPQIQCVKEGEERFGVITREIDAVEALEFVFKLEEIKLKLNTDGDLYKRVERLQKYYENQGDTESAQRYSNALTKMEEARLAIDSLREQMKNSIESEGKLTVENLYMFKEMTQEIVEGNLMKIAYAMIGVNVDLVSESELLESKDCENDDECFEERFKQCVIGTTFEPSEEQGEIRLEIAGSDSGACTVILKIENSGDVNCVFNEAQYKYMPLSREAFLSVCGEELKSKITMPIEEFEDESEFEGEYDGGKDQFCQINEGCNCNEICEENIGEDANCDDCLRFGTCGDGLCEPKVNENLENCPEDCTSNIIEENSIDLVEEEILSETTEPVMSEELITQ